MGACRQRYSLLMMVVLILVCSCLGDAFGKAVISPQVHSDGRVTFRMNGPNAKKVELEAQFLQNAQAMTKEADGVWSITVGPASPEIYEYSFIVDDFSTIDPSNSWLKFWQSTAKNLVEISGEKPMFFQEQDVPHGAVQSHRYHSKSLGVTRGLYVYTPAEYENSQNEKYPVLYLLHGMGDVESCWVTVGRANIILDNLIAQNKAMPMIVVMPYGHTPGARGARRGGRSSFATDLIEDVIPYVEKNFRVVADREQRAIAGLSMGGGQSIRIGLGNMELFGWVGAYSSAVPGDEQLDKLLEKPAVMNDKYRLLWIGCGRKDFLFNANKRFLDALETRNIKHVAHITEGGHEWRIWRMYLNEFAPLLFKKAN